jgi:hypothetical protein
VLGDRLVVLQDRISAEELRLFTHKVRPNVRFDPKATELLRDREMTRRPIASFGTAEMQRAFSPSAPP